MNNTVNQYTVVGFWPDGNYRFCASLQAATPEAAEAKVLDEYPGVAITATFEGVLYPVDDETYVTYSR